MKINFSKITAFIMMLIMIITGIFINTGIVSAKEAAKFKLNKTNVTMTAGNITTLKATDQNGKVIAVKWSSNNKSIAKVSAKGAITAVKKGNATITATATIKGKEYKAVCTVKVNAKVYVSAITIKKTLELVTGDTYWLDEVVLPKNATDKTLQYTSSNKKVVTVSSAGELKAIVSGTATITVTALDGSEVTAKMKVTVLKNLTITSKDAVEGKISLSDKVYGNVTIDNSVGDAQIDFNKVKIAGTLSLENNAGYALNLNECDIKNVNLKDIPKDSKTKLSYGALLAEETVVKIPVINITGNTKISIIITESSIIIKQGDSSEVQEIKIDSQNAGNVSLSLEGFKGALDVSAATGSKVDINMKACEITNFTAQGNAGQTLNINDVGTTDAEKSSVGSLQLTGQLATVVNVPTTTISIDQTSNGAKLTCNQAVTTINNLGQGSSIVVNSTVKNIVSSGNNASVEVGAAATVGEVVSSGNQSTITGTGTVTIVKVEGNDNSVDVPGATVKVGDNSNGTIVDGNEVEPGGSKEIPGPQPSNPSSGGGGGGSGGSSDNKTVKETVYATDQRTGSATVTVEGISITINDLNNVFLLASLPINANYKYPKDQYVIAVSAVNGQGYNPIQIKNSDETAATAVYYIKVDSANGKVTVKGNTTSKITVKIGGTAIIPTKVY